MKPKKTSEIPIGDLIYEVKYDGGSSTIKVEKGKVEIQHGVNPDDQSYKYPELVEDLKKCQDGKYIAELCVIDKDHIGGFFPHFLRRQCQEHFKILSRSKQYPVTAVIHDIVETDTDCTSLPLLDRKEQIKKRVKESDHIQIVRFYDTPEPILALKGKVEGCVAKRKDSQYRMDSRDGWYKTRFNKREVVVFSSYEEWEKETGEKGLVLITSEKKRATLA
jgi:ATP-dependent DNA ligase